MTRSPVSVREQSGESESPSIEVSFATTASSSSTCCATPARSLCHLCTRSSERAAFDEAAEDEVSVISLDCCAMHPADGFSEIAEKVEVVGDGPAEGTRVGETAVESAGELPE
jgi:hypothetical protein